MQPAGATRSSEAPARHCINTRPVSSATLNRKRLPVLDPVSNVACAGDSYDDAEQLQAALLRCVEAKPIYPSQQPPKIVAYPARPGNIRLTAALVKTTTSRRSSPSLPLSALLPPQDIQAAIYRRHGGLPDRKGHHMRSIWPRRCARYSRTARRSTRQSTRSEAISGGMELASSILVLGKLCQNFRGPGGSDEVLAVINFRRETCADRHQDGHSQRSST